MTDPTSSTPRTPHIEKIEPRFALSGSEIRIVGKNLTPAGFQRPIVYCNGYEASLSFATDTAITARVPDGATSGPLTVLTELPSNSVELTVARMLAEELHPVANPAVDLAGNVYATFSGSRGQSVPVSIYKIDGEETVQPFVTDLMNATGLALDSEGFLYVSSRYDGTVYRVTASGTMSTYAKGMGVATGIAFDNDRNLYVGDRNGTIFKIGRDRQIYVFATLEPSMAAYHLAFGPNGNLYVTGPTTSSNECVYEVDPHGTVNVFCKGLGRPQGLAFDLEGNLYVAASCKGERGILRVTPAGEVSLAVAGNGIVGLAFAPGNSLVVATTDAVHQLAWGIAGRVLVAD